MKKIWSLMIWVLLGVACSGPREPITPMEDSQNEVISVMEPNVQKADGCLEWGKYLTQCAPYRCVFAAPDGELLGREIDGAKDGKCQYEEELRPDRVLQCSLPKDSLEDMAQYYQMSEEEVDVSLEVIRWPDGRTLFREVIAGTPVATPLQEALTDGTCQILEGSLNFAEPLDLEFGEGKEVENIEL